jgi:hypothetical protein
MLAGVYRQIRLVLLLRPGGSNFPIRPPGGATSNLFSQFLLGMTVPPELTVLCRLLALLLLPGEMALHVLPAPIHG